MHLRKLLLIAALFTFGQTTLVGQENPEKQKAYEAMKAAEKAYNLIDFQVKAMRGRKVVPVINQGRNAVIIPQVPQSMLDQAEEAWRRYQQAAAAYSKFEKPAQKRMAPAEFIQWLEAQSEKINDPAVHAKIMETVQGDNWESARTLQLLMQLGTKAISYRDDLLAYARTEELKKRGALIRLQVVEAIVRVDPSTKAELTQLTKDWFANEHGYERSLLRALEGRMYTPNANKPSGKQSVGKK
jgi:hypothetical protein